LADVVVKAAYGSVVEDDGFIFVGFAEGEDAEEAYVLFRQALDGGPIWFEVNDETFGAEDAIQRVTSGPKGFDIMIRDTELSAFGYAATVSVQIGPDCEDGPDAVTALKQLLGSLWVD
jgi:hypothetical protein